MLSPFSLLSVNDELKHLGVSRYPVIFLNNCRDLCEVIDTSHSSLGNFLKQIGTIFHCCDEITQIYLKSDKFKRC
jgi:hypothetical protein